MATHPDFLPATRYRRAIYIDPAKKPFEPAPADLVALQQEFDAEIVADQRRRAFIDCASQVHARVTLAAAILLLLYIAIGLAGAVIGGRL